jgi:hypothetical protein
LPAAWGRRPPPRRPRATPTPRWSAAAAPTDYARWLVRALPERTRAHTRAAAAADATGAARALLAEAMQRSDVVDEALAARRAQARAHADRQAQALADELSLRPRA